MSTPAFKRRTNSLVDRWILNVHRVLFFQSYYTSIDWLIDWSGFDAGYHVWHSRSRDHYQSSPRCWWWFIVHLLTSLSRSAQCNFQWLQPLFQYTNNIHCVLWYSSSLLYNSAISNFPSSTFIIAKNRTLQCIHASLTSVFFYARASGDIPRISAAPKTA